MTPTRLWLLLPAATFFLCFGLGMLWIAYYQDNPIVFLALFFSSNLIILLSAACLVGLIWRLFGSTDPGEAGKPGS
ncbi:MAG: hypothetical protein V1816_07425 [Pseudomonadota bacterium]